MKVDGKYMQENMMTGDTCYLPVFDHGLDDSENSSAIIIGNIMMDRYYVIYDMSPLEYD
jgi:hypothetical protein